MNIKYLIFQKKLTNPTPAPSSKLVRDHSPSTMESGHEPVAGVGLVRRYKNNKINT